MSNPEYHDSAYDYVEEDTNRYETEDWAIYEDYCGMDGQFTSCDLLGTEDCAFFCPFHHLLGHEKSC